MCNIYNYIGLTESGGKIKEGKSIAKGVTRTRGQSTRGVHLAVD